MSELPAVLLRARRPDDFEMLFSIAQDLSTWDERTDRPPSPLTREQYAARLAHAGGPDDDTDNASFVIEVAGEGVGSALLFDFDHLARHAEAGISLVPAARGRGIGTAAIVQLVDFGFARRNLHRIHLQAIASNTAAIRAYEKAGFVVEGRHREHAWVRGHYEDIVRMGLLRSQRPAQS
ncbi:MAG: GNAT family protein [Marmoricola sp.]